MEIRCIFIYLYVKKIFPFQFIGENLFKWNLIYNLFADSIVYLIQDNLMLGIYE